MTDVQEAVIKSTAFTIWQFMTPMLLHSQKRQDLPEQIIQWTISLQNSCVDFIEALHALFLKNTCISKSLQQLCSL